MANSPLASPSATVRALERHGLRLKKSLGQHFLVDDNVVGRILALADLPADAIVLEIGPGIGTLTAGLCGVTARIVAVERDAALLPALAEIQDACPCLAVVHGDAVKLPIADMERPWGPPTHLVANLPYAVAATVVLRMFEEAPALRTAVVMVQAEVADRMCASPGSKDYGAYTVKLRLRARPSGRFTVPRSCFLPPPRVDSAVLRFDRHELADPATAAVASSVAAHAFAQRRKTLRNSVLSSSGWDPLRFDAALETAGIDGRLRAEALAVEQYVLLSHAVLSEGLCTLSRTP
jgi:16S rRNA (adenine1518-N6/adenine1519-N6)-dimethyltransferase